MDHCEVENLHSVVQSPKNLVSLFWNLEPKDRDKQFQSPEQVAHIVRKSPRTVRQWRAEGKVHGIKVGRDVYIYMPSVEAYLHRLQDEVEDEEEEAE